MIVNQKQLVARLLPQYQTCTKLINYIYNVQQLRAARLDFSAAARVLGQIGKPLSGCATSAQKPRLSTTRGTGYGLTPT